MSYSRLDYSCISFSGSIKSLRDTLSSEDEYVINDCERCCSVEDSSVQSCKEVKSIKEDNSEAPSLFGL